MMKSWLLGYSILDESLMLDWCVLDYILDNSFTENFKIYSDFNLFFFFFTLYYVCLKPIANVKWNTKVSFHECDWHWHGWTSQLNQVTLVCLD